MFDHPLSLFLSTNYPPLALVVGAFDLFDAALFTGLIFVDLIGKFSLPDRKLDIIPFSTFEMWVYIHNFTTNPPLLLYLIFEINVCSLIIFSWLMLIRFRIFKSNINVWEWLLGTLLTREMKGTSQGKYDTWWWWSCVYFLVPSYVIIIFYLSLAGYFILLLCFGGNDLSRGVLEHRFSASALLSIELIREHFPRRELSSLPVPKQSYCLISKKL